MDYMSSIYGWVSGSRLRSGLRQAIGRRWAVNDRLAKHLWDKCRALPEVPWDFKLDCCYARAHVMARAISESAVHVQKAWVFAPGHFAQGKPLLRIPGADIRNTLTGWRYHVAPVVMGHGKAGLEPTVVDPSTAERPLSLKDWLRAMDGETGYCVLTSMDVFYHDPKVGMTDFDTDFSVSLAKLSEHRQKVGGGY
jgi:hypothetical protein